MTDEYRTQRGMVKVGKAWVWKDSGVVNCDECDEKGCVYRDRYQKNPMWWKGERTGALEKCPRLKQEEPNDQNQ